MPSSTSAFDLEIRLADGSWLGLMLDTVRNRDGEPVAGRAKSVAEALEARVQGSELVDPLAPVVQEDWSKGLGVHYHAAEGVYTRTPGYALPAGAVNLAYATPSVDAAFVAIAEYGLDLYIADSGSATTAGAVLKLAGGSETAISTVLVPPVGQILRDLCVFENGSGQRLLYASTERTDASQGRLWAFDGTTWTSSPATGAGAFNRGCGRMKRVFWTTNDGVSAPRLVMITSSSTIAYSIPEADPLLPSSWVEGVKVMTDTYVDELAAAARHVWIGTKSDVHDLTELGDTPGLMGYDNRAPNGVRFPLQYLDGYLYRAAGSSLDRIRVDDQQRAENPGQCAPGWGTAAENEWRGYPTAMTVDQGYLVVAIQNPTTGRSGVFWGKDRTILGIDETMNPLVWYGPEIVSTGFRRITVLAPSMLNGDRRLWIGSTTGHSHELAWQSLPVAGAPLQDLLSAGRMRFSTGVSPSAEWNATPRLYLPSDTLGDKVAKKIIYGMGTGSRGLDPDDGTRLTLETRADPAPGQATWQTFYGVTESPSQEIVADVVVEGHSLERRYGFVSPQGEATPPNVAVLDGARLTCWVVTPDFGVREVRVAYGSGVLDRANVSDDQRSRDPEEVTRQLIALTRLARTELRDPNDRRWSCRLRQHVTRTVEYPASEPWGKRVRATLQLVIFDEVASS